MICIRKIIDRVKFYRFLIFLRGDVNCLYLLVVVVEDLNILLCFVDMLVEFIFILGDVR